MEYKSLWVSGIKYRKVKELKKNIDVDVLIIGGGMTGLNCAYGLRDSKLKVCLVEQNRIGMGVSSRTTGKINYLQECIYSDLEKFNSFDTAKNYLESQLEAIKKIRNIIKKEKISCDLDRVASYVLAFNDEEYFKLKKEYNILKKIGINVKERKDNLLLNAKYMIYVDDTYIFNPIKYMYALKDICYKKKIDIYENTRIKELIKCKDGYKALANNYEIKAKKVIVASHYPFFLKPYMMPLKVYNERSYAIASRIDNYKKETAISNSLPCKSIRYYKSNKKNYFIYLGQTHNICENMDIKDNMNKVLDDVKKMNLKPEFCWINEDMMSVDRIPYIGRLIRNDNTLLIGTAYSTWGMTNSVLAGVILSDIILGRKNKYESLFDPLRVNILVDIESYIGNMNGNIKSYLINSISKNKKWYPESVTFKKIDNKNIAIYDDGKKKHVVLSNCPHLGCPLLFNDVEKTWDCPCHASRFDIDGKCIKGPSCYDISYEVDEKEL